MTTLLLVRHGETLWNQQGRMQGQHDSPLTPLGLAQARRLAKRLKSVSFAALYTSDLGRAHQTARCIADETGHAVIARRDLRERSFGVFEGLTNAEIEARYPEHHVRFARREPDFAMPGGESASRFRERCIAALDSIAHAHEGSTVVVVAHGLVLDALYRSAQGLSLDVARGFPLLNCSINSFRRERQRWVAVSMCDVAHLADNEATRFSDASVGGRAGS